MDWDIASAFFMGILIGHVVARALYLTTQTKRKPKFQINVEAVRKLGG